MHIFALDGVGEGEKRGDAADAVFRALFRRAFIASVVGEDEKKKTLTASTNPQLATGPQKCVVLGPVGELMNCMRRDDDAISFL